MSHHRTAPQVGGAVIGLSPTEAEWLEYESDGTQRYAAVPIGDCSPESLVHAVLAARESAGGSHTRAVLALRGGLVRQQIVEASGLNRREATKVMARKAARAWDEPLLPPLFSCTEHTGGTPDTPPRWVLVAAERQMQESVARGLRANGLGLERITCEELAVLDKVKTHQGAEGTGTICVTVGTNAIQVSLIAGDGLFMVESLKGNLQQDPHLVASLLQTLRTIAGYWRRTQRGSQVSQIVVLGLAPERGELLCTALRAGFPEAGVTRFPEGSGEDPDNGEPDNSGRVTLLEACLLDDGFCPTLSFSLPATRRRAWSAVCASALGVLATIGLVHTEASNRFDAVEIRIQAARVASQELATFERSRAQSVNELHGIVDSIARTRSLLKSGVDFDALLATVLGQLRGGATVLEIAVGRPNEGTRELSLKARARGSTAAMIQSIGEIQRKLAALPSLHDVQVDLPSNVNRDSDRSQLDFSIRLKVDGSS